jgi:hypothetical protein
VSTPWGPLKLTCERSGGKVTVRTQCERSFEVLVELPEKGEPVRMKSSETRTLGGP